MMRLMIRFAAAACCGVMTACTSTSVSTVWKNPESHEPVHFEKVLALVVNATPAERRAGEDVLASQITSAKAVPAYTLVSDDDTKDKQKILGAIEGKGFDGAAVIRLVSSDKRTTYVPPTYHQNFDPWSPHYGPTALSPGYTITDTSVTAEVSLYSLRDQKLIWAGSSTTEDPANIRDLVTQVAKSAAGELRRQGLVE